MLHGASPNPVSRITAVAAFLCAASCSSTPAGVATNPPDAMVVDVLQSRDAGDPDAHNGNADAPRDATQPGDAPRDVTLPDVTLPHLDAGHDAESDVSVRDAPSSEAPDPADAPSETRAPADAPSEAHAPVDAPYDAGVPELRYIGRTLTDGTAAFNGTCSPATPCFEWSGTQVVARFTGATEIDFLMSDGGNYFDVYVDGTLTSNPAILGNGGAGQYPAATGLDSTQTHEVRLYRRTEALTGGLTLMSGVTFPFGGTLLAPSPAPPLRIELIGDSISCAKGILGTDASCVAEPDNEDHDLSYGAITARALQGDLFTTAASYYGMYMDYFGTMEDTIPSIYALTAPFGTTSTTLWNFSTWVPDIVLLNLGTNDFSGSNGDPGQPFVTAYVAFLQQLRQYYAEATIVCLNGPMLVGAQATLAQTYIQSAISMTNDPKVLFMAFPTQSQASGDEGCYAHPNVATHQAMATQLISFLQPLL
jgi:hypothetical protein